MNKIDLSKYVGKRVAVTLRDGSSGKGTILSDPGEYTFYLACADAIVAYKANGMWHTNKQSEYDIVKISEISK